MYQYWGPLLAAALLVVAGCNADFSSTVSRPTGEVIAEGTLYRVKYDRGDGSTWVITRESLMNEGGGDWNVDAHAKLTNEALIITYLNRSGFGPHIIPMNRLLEVQFGDGRIAIPFPIGTATTTDQHATIEH